MLAASDFLLASAVANLNPGMRGLEAGDSVTIDPSDANRLLIDFTASTPGDYVRVFTMESPGATPTPIPIPAAGWLLVGALGALAGLRRRV